MNLKWLTDSSAAGPSIWKICTPCNELGEAPLLVEFGTFLEDKTYDRYMKGLLSLLELITSSSRGPEALRSNTALCHEAVAGEAVFELIKGPLRLYWFYGLDRRVMLAATVIVKRGSKTPPDVRDALITLKRRYTDAHEQGRLRMFD